MGGMRGGSSCSVGVGDEECNAAMEGNHLPPIQRTSPAPPPIHPSAAFPLLLFFPAARTPPKIPTGFCSQVPMMPPPTYRPLLAATPHIPVSVAAAPYRPAAASRSPPPPSRCPPTTMGTGDEAGPAKNSGRRRKSTSAGNQRKQLRVMREAHSSSASPAAAAAAASHPSSAAPRAPTAVRDSGLSGHVSGGSSLWEEEIWSEGTVWLGLLPLLLAKIQGRASDTESTGVVSYDRGLGTPLCAARALVTWRPGSHNRAAGWAPSQPCSPAAGHISMSCSITKLWKTFKLRVCRQRRTRSSGTGGGV